MTETVSISKLEYEMLCIGNDLAKEFINHLCDLEKKGNKLIDGFKKWMDKNPARTTVLTIEGIQEMSDGAYSDEVVKLLLKYRKASKEYEQEQQEQEEKELREKRTRKVEEYKKQCFDFREKTLHMPIVEIKKHMPKEVGRFCYGHGSTAENFVFTQIGKATLERLSASGIKTPADLANYTTKELIEACKLTSDTRAKYTVKYLTEMYGITPKEEEATND